MSGFYLMHRGWMDRPIFREPYNRAQAWVWLIENAAFKDTRIAVGSKWVNIKRGQLCYSLRYLAKAWRWDDAKVRRFIASAASAKMIRSVTDAGQTLITICNYDQYQVIQSVGDAVPDAVPDAAPTQHRRSGDANKKEGNEVNEDISEETDVSSAADPKRVIFEDIAGWLVEETGRSLASIKAWLGKVANECGDGALIDAASRIRAGPYVADPIAALTAELKRYRRNGKTSHQSPASKIYAGAALALADRAAARAQRSADRGADLDPTEPLLDSG